MVTTLLGIVTLVRDVQPLKASDPIEVTLFGMLLMEVRLIQSEKVLPSIMFIPLGIVTVVKLRHPLKAPYPIEVTPFGMLMESKFLQL